MLGISSVLQLFFALNHSAIYFHFIDLKFVLGGARFHCGTFEVMCMDVCAQKLVQTILSSHDICGHVWMCVQKLVQTVLSSHDICGLVYPEACIDNPVITWGMWTCVPRSLYRQSCRHMNLLFSVSFQVNGDIPPRFKKSAHEIILDFIRSRPPFKSSMWSDTSPWLAYTWQHVPPTSPCHRTQLLEECWRWAFLSDCEARLWTQGHIAFVCIAALYLRVQTPHLGYRKSTAASSFTVAMALCSWGSFWRPWIRGSDQVWELVCVYSVLRLPPLAPQPALTRASQTPCTFSNFSN